MTENWHVVPCSSPQKLRICSKVIVIPTSSKELNNLGQKSLFADQSWTSQNKDNKNSTLLQLLTGLYAE